MASHAVQLADVAMPERTRTLEIGKGRGTLGANPGGEGFIVLHWQLEPGAWIRPHAQTYGNVVTVGMAGEAVVDNYEMVDEQDLTTGREVRLRRTNHQLLRARSINTVPISHVYVHGFRAGPEGARFLDITSHLGPRQKTTYLEVEPEPVDAARELWTGRWFQVGD